MAVYTDYQFQMEDPGRGLELGVGDSIPNGVGIGVEGGASTESAPNNGGAQAGGENAMDGLTSDASASFMDGQDNRPFVGMDAMENLAGQGEVEVLEQNQMYSSQESLPFDFPLPESASPLIESEGNA